MASITARELYDQGNDYEAGAMVASEIQKNQLPKWAGRILEFVAEQQPHPSSVSRLIEVTKSESYWPLSSDLFYEIREETIAVEKSSEPSPHYLSLLHLSENVAKITANASEQANFDTDCAFWIPQIVRYLVENGNLKSNPDDLLNLVFPNG